MLYARIDLKHRAAARKHRAQTQYLRPIYAGVFLAHTQHFREKFSRAGDEIRSVAHIHALVRGTPAEQAQPVPRGDGLEIIRRELA